MTVTPSPRRATIMQQATVNLLADMGNVQPVTLMSGLVPATAVDGHHAADVDHHVARRRARPSPTAAPSPSPERPPTAAAAWSPGVEVSTDGGSTWHPVTTMSAGRHERDLELHLDGDRRWARSPSSRGRPTTAATSRRLATA